MARWLGVALSALMLALAPSGGAVVAGSADAEHDRLVRQDLFAIITLEGHHCVEVLDFTRKDENDFVAHCRSGDRFRVYVVDEGRVVVERLDSKVE